MGGPLSQALKGFCHRYSLLPLQVVPEWERLTAHIEADPESKERLGWVREMYAFSVAAALRRVRLEMLPCPQCTLIAQPPADAARPP